MLHCGRCARPAPSEPTRRCCSLRYVFTLTSVLLFWDVGELVGETRDPAGADPDPGVAGGLVGEPPCVTTLGTPGKSLFTVPSAVGPAIFNQHVSHLSGGIPHSEKHKNSSTCVSFIFAQLNENFS